MNTIKIKHVIPGDKENVYIKYKMMSVYFGNSKRIYFRSRKKAEQFLTKTNKFLNERLFDGNIIMVSLFTTYRHHWFYLTVLKNENVKQCIFNADRSFTLSYERSYSRDSGYFSFHHLINGFKDIQVAADIIMQECRRLKRMSDLHFLESLVIQAQKQIDMLLNYPDI